MPKVTVCIPTYNRADYLSYSINTVLRQTYEDFELIVCDDGSSDRTPEVVAAFEDSRIIYLRHPQNMGRSLNMRSGFTAARGEYFIKFDDDDGLTPEFLAKTVPILEQEKNVDFVCTDHWIIDRFGQRVASATKKNSAKWGKDRLQLGIIPDLERETFSYQSLQVGSTLFRYRSLADVDYMRPQADGCEDFDLLVRLALAGKQAYFLPELLMEYRFHGGQTSLKQAVHFLQANLFCTEGYHFNDVKLEEERVKRTAFLQESLGIKLIEKGDSEAGRVLIEKASKLSGKSQRARLGLLLSYLPLNLRQLAFQGFRQLRPKDYVEQVRAV